MDMTFYIITCKVTSDVCITANQPYLKMLNVVKHFYNGICILRCYHHDTCDCIQFKEKYIVHGITQVNDVV